MLAVTVQELQQLLTQYPPEAVLVVLREGNGNYTPVAREDIKLLEAAYFGGDEPENEQGQFLQIGVSL